MPTASTLLVLGLWRRSPSLIATGLSLSFAATLFTIPAFLLGEGAEDVVEHLLGVSEHLIEEHEEAADIALALSLATGMMSAVSLGLRLANARLQQIAVKVSLPLLVAASLALAYTAFKGGKIRHPEAHSSAASPSETHENHDEK